MRGGRRPTDEAIDALDWALEGVEGPLGLATGVVGVELAMVF